jgi:signal transduction histidine kinase
VSKRPSLRHYFRKKLLQQSAVTLVVFAFIALVFTYLIARIDVGNDLVSTARSVTKSFQSQILEGDIKKVETQIQDILSLEPGEIVKVIDPDGHPLYRGDGSTSEIKQCNAVDLPCFDGFFGRGHIVHPIYFDSNNEHKFGSLYLTRAPHLRPTYFMFIFGSFVTAALLFLLMIFRQNDKTTVSIATELRIWAQRLKENPKDQTPLGLPPFAELEPLREAIEGLNDQIQEFELEASQKAKTLILRGIAHDLLGPVAQVQMYLATLQMHLDHQSELQDIIFEMEDSLRKVSMIASQVKSLRPEEGSDAQRVTRDFGHAVESELESLRSISSVADKGIVLNFKSDEHAAIKSPLSRTEISRILRNLVENAAHASQPSSSIDVSVGQLNSESFVTIADRGAGIPENVKPRLFEPDFTTKKGSGTGLGLFIVKDICEKKLGRIDIESEVSRGTKITVFLPIESGVSHAT